MENAYFILCNLSAIVVVVCFFALLKNGVREEGRYLHPLLYTYAIVSFVFIARLVVHYINISPLMSSSIDYLLLQSFLTICFFAYPLFLWVHKRGKSRELFTLTIFSPVLIVFAIYQTAIACGVEFSNFNPLLAITDGTFYQFNKLFAYIICLLTVLFSIFVVAIILRDFKGNIVIIQYVVAHLFSPLVMVLMFFDPAHTYLYALIYHVIVIICAINFTYVFIYLCERFSLSTFDSDCYVPLSSERKGEERATEEAKYVSNPQLWQRLEELMNSDEQPWRNKELQISDLAKMLRSNRTSLSREIHFNGYQSFYDYLAEYRVKEFCRMLEAGKVSNITLAFAAVGFHSVSTAFKQFRRIHGLTPAQYIARMSSNS